jgi:hypothetical protein
MRVQLVYFGEEGQTVGGGTYETSKLTMPEIKAEVMAMEAHPGLGRRHLGDILVHPPEDQRFSLTTPVLIRG